MVAHRYSGYPGAWCLDCGQEDPWEAAIACGDYDGANWTSKEAFNAWWPAIIRKCPSPGQGLYDPYRKTKEGSP